ncbi:MAG TPA: hypothetical protein VGR35_10370 [Tepidisphaeraceae bacterium]|nr:hypothetical protein [Tepidisphaeraceae bacterium]
MQDPTDPLSATGRHLLKLDRNAYAALVPAHPGSIEAKDLLESVQPAQLLASGVVKRAEEADAMLAGLWLWHDWLEESHAIAQGLHGASGSFWHAIMHRREGDFSNAKYWYARCADHPVLPSLNAQASAILNPLPADKSLLRLTANGWNGAAFVDFVAQLHDQPNDPRHPTAVLLQRLEWRILFDHCARVAGGG